MKITILLTAFLAMCACIACNKHTEMPVPTYYGRDTTVNYTQWKHIDTIYPGKDSTILASCALSEKTLMLATKSGISYFNTLTNHIDSFIPLSQQMQGYPLAYMNKYFTIYQDYNGLYLFDNKTLRAAPTALPVSKNFPFPAIAITDNKIFYEYDLVGTGSYTGNLQIKYLSIALDTTASGNKYISSYTEESINLPTETALPIGGAINFLKTFDATLYVSYADYFYRVDFDGSYEKLQPGGVNIYPNSMFQVNGTLTLLSNDVKAYYPYSLFYSFDNGKNWQQSPSDNFSYDELRFGQTLYLESQLYVCAGWGNMYHLSFAGNALSAPAVNIGNLHVLDISALYPVAEKYVYGVSNSGIYMINKSLFQ